MTRLFFSLLSVIWVLGCATSEPAVLRYGVQDAPEGKRLMWPPEPEVPRYLYAGQLVGEANFRSPAAGAAQGLKGLLRAIAGLVVGESRPLELQRPQSGTVDREGRIYVTDASRQAVVVFDPVAGKLDVWEKAEGLASFGAPVAVAVGKDVAVAKDLVYVSDAELGIVARLGADGTPQRALGRGLFKRPTGLVLDAERGELYVADTAAHDIKVLDLSGNLKRVLGRRGEGDGEFNYPTHLALADGELYVTDTMNSRIQVLDGASGAMRRSFGVRGLYVGNLVRPKGIALDSERNVYVVESYYDHLLVVDRLGRFLMGIGGLGAGSGNFYLPAGVWTDHLNRVFVADMFNGRVVLFQHLGGGTDGEQ
jgi:DNA-binding beta-propeller fold protein YncE